MKSETITNLATYLTRNSRGSYEERNVEPEEVTKLLEKFAAEICIEAINSIDPLD